MITINSKLIIELLMFIAVVFFTAGINSQVPFNTSPSWISTPANYYSTGAGWTDINRDGWLDLVLSNGNDMSRKKVAVYLNNNGTLPLTPSWQSNDIDYHGHLSVGDINADGYPDVAVSVYIGALGFSQKAKLKIYQNNNGTLSSDPVWISQDSMYTFSCAFGDADGDGDLDLAVACGESYEYRPDKNRIYYNTNGVFASLPGWQNTEIGYSMDVAWADFNNDGKLDLVFAGEGNTPNRIYLNYGDSIGRTAAWTSTDPSKYANSLFTGDVNNDGYIDLAISDNNQLGGSGKFKIYLNNSGTLSGTPYWQSAFSGYGSGINLNDIDFDNDLDLITGGWWSPCRIYLNNGGNFNALPEWTSSTNSVVEAIVFGDYNNNGLDTITTNLTGNGIKKLYYNSRKPVHKLIHLKVNGVALPYSEFCYDIENGWFNLKNAPANGQNIEIKTITSHSNDFAVSNWDANLGNYIFNNNYVIGVKPGLSDVPVKFELFQNYPNPFNPITKIKFQVPLLSSIQITIYDVLGRNVQDILNEKVNTGIYETEWNGTNLPSGVYYIKLLAVPDNEKDAVYSKVIKSILIK